MSEQITYKRQSVDYLGFLRSQLSGLQGMATLTYELIQNADDVLDDQGHPGASRITLDVCDEALYVENDGVFREKDFDRMQRLSWGDKREEQGTTGAFGIGFISVYQVTDAPEIFSSERHWRIRPEAPEDRRIEERQLETQHTRFRLPWAFEFSQVRRELGSQPVRPDQLDGFIKEIDQAIELAALFLKNLTVLELKRSGKLIRRIEKLVEGDQVLLDDGIKSIMWRILRTDFDHEAKILRNMFGEIIEAKRQSIVQIAIPEEPLIEGTLYAFLPSEVRAPLPFHINADFYPSQDRKRILFDQDYKSEWNREAIRSAAQALAEHIVDLLDLLPQKLFWKFMEKVRECGHEPRPDPVFADFWEHLRPIISQKQTVLTVSDKCFSPSQVFYLDTDDEIAAASIFEGLGLPSVHPDLRPYRNLLLDVGVRPLRLPDIAKAVRTAGLTERISLEKAPQALKNREDWQKLWKAMNALWSRTLSEEPRQALQACSIAFGVDGALWPLNQLLQADEETQSLFPDVSWFDNLFPELQPIPTEWVPKFDASDAVDALAVSSAEELQQAWANGKLELARLYGWFENHRQEIAGNSKLVGRLRSLPIWPTASHKLDSLDDLYLAGDFDDPLGLAQIVDVQALGGRREFLENVLKVRTLDIVTYSREWLPNVFQSGNLTLENRRKLIRVLAENLGKIQDQQEVKSALQPLALVECLDGKFYPARQVYFVSDVLDVLGLDVPRARMPDRGSDSVRTLFDWLGVATDPRPSDILGRIRTLVAQPPTKKSITSIERIFAYLAERWLTWEDRQKSAFSALKDLAWLPGTRPAGVWHKPQRLYAIYQSYLFETQGNFLAVDRRLQQQANRLIDYLGINVEPTPQQVVRHWLTCSEQKKKFNQQVYTFMNRNTAHPALEMLKGYACLLLRTEIGEERFFRPDQVYWEAHPFGPYRFRLGPEFGVYKALFDRLGVQPSPGPEDAIQVLFEISEKFGGANLNLEETEQVIILNCWKELDTALAHGVLEVGDLHARLGQEKVIPDARQILEPPEHLFFEDRPNFANKFQILKNSVIPRVEGAWRAMQAAGVRRLSEAISVHLHDHQDLQDDTEMAGWVQGRLHLVRRVADVEKSGNRDDLNIGALQSLAYQKAKSLSVVHTLRAFKKVESSPPEETEAVLMDHTLLIACPDGYRPWVSIARELAYVLQPSGEVSSLAMALKEILSSATPQEAGAVLDAFGYPPLTIVEPAIPASGSVSGLGGDETIPETPIEAILGGDIGRVPMASQPTETLPPTEGQIAPLPGGSPVGQHGLGAPPSRRSKTSRLISYVYPDDQVARPEGGSTSNPFRRDRVAKAGVARALAYEEEQDRHPTDMETVQTNHPGYDIEATDAEGNIVRCIEVKALSGIWDAQNPAQMTKTEFEKARELGDLYWLYIVEQAESEEAQIYRIQNPANRAGYYLFDHGWLPLAVQA